MMLPSQLLCSADASHNLWMTTNSNDMITSSTPQPSLSHVAVSSQFDTSQLVTSQASAVTPQPGYGCVTL
jgi:hypothetical protein